MDDVAGKPRYALDMRSRTVAPLLGLAVLCASAAGSSCANSPLPGVADAQNPDLTDGSSGQVAVGQGGTGVRAGGTQDSSGAAGHAGASAQSSGGRGGGGSAGSGRGGGGGGGGDAAGSSTVCNDMGEPQNDQSASAVALEDISDCDGIRAKTASLAGSADVDWYGYNASDAICTITDYISPWAKATSPLGTATVCVYSNNSGADSCQIGVKSSELSGFLGCCGQTEAQVADYGMFGTTQDARVLIKVTSFTGTSSCGFYTLEYGYTHLRRRRMPSQKRGRARDCLARRANAPRQTYLST